jgi:hypothetical protein
MITEKYCSKCNKPVVGTHKQILDHQSIEVDSLPTGLVYIDRRSLKGSYGIVAGVLGVESGLYNDGRQILKSSEIDGKQVKRPIIETHGFNHLVVPYSIEGRTFLAPLVRNAKEVIRSYETGERIVPTMVELAGFQEVYARFLENECNGNEELFKLLKKLKPEMLFGVFSNEGYGKRAEEVNELIRNSEVKRERCVKLPPIAFSPVGLEALSMSA